MRRSALRSNHSTNKRALESSRAFAKIFVLACGSLAICAANAANAQTSPAAQGTPAQQAQTPPAPATEPPPAAPAGPTAMTTPAMAGPLAANPKPLSFDAGLLGPVYVTGVFSGLGLVQSNPVPEDYEAVPSLSNGQVFIQKNDGVFQYFLQVGAYTLPALGTRYFNTGKATADFYSPIPQAFVKIAPTDNFSIMAGKLPTLIGAEYTFSFENMNIQRGLLWNQENAVNRGVQANYTVGPLAFSLSLNDGY